MNIIGISGRAGSGKSTVTGLLAAAINAAGYTVAIDAFAAGIKMQARASGWNGVKDEEGRKLLQDIGEHARLKDPDHWITALRQRWAFVDGVPEFLIISDCRHANEATFCRSSFLGYGVVWRIEGRMGNLTPEQMAHPSEKLDWPLIEGDTLVTNDQDFPSLVVKIDQLVADKAHLNYRRK